ncbi:MAG: VanZ family protein [Pyrinomonadaceae bacterium]
MANAFFTNSIWRGRIIRYAPLLILTAVILSTTDIASMNETSRFIRPFLEFLLPNSSPETITEIHGLIRKLAHPCVYALLAFLASRAYRYSSINILRNFWPIAAMLFSVAVAITDEILQSQNPSRTGTAWDVGLDAIGAFIAIALYYLLRPTYLKQAQEES